MTEPVECLVVEDDPQIRNLLRSVLSQQDFSVTTAASAEEGIQIAEATELDIVLCDISLPGKSGIEALGELRDAQPDTPVILITAFPSIESAVEGLRAGASDYITKPFIREELLMVIERALDHQALRRENRRLRQLAQESHSFAGLIAESPAMRNIVSQIPRIRNSRSNVLITGESGTGKEVVARAIHTSGPAANQPFVSINCSALPGELLESELFGHVRGAFTGAIADKRGLFEEAGRGTIFLDEIGDLDLGLQGKLLRAIQDREVRPVGGTRPLAFKARVLAATNVDLKAARDGGRFRSDLFYRLNVIRIHIPPLRERREDVPVLAEHFLKHHSGGQERHLSAAASSVLMRRTWDGNARELENIIERAVNLHDPLVIQPEHLDFEEPTVASGVELRRLYELAAELSVSARQLMDEYITHVVQRNDGNKAQAARQLGVAVRTLYRKEARSQNPEPVE